MASSSRERLKRRPFTSPAAKTTFVTDSVSGHEDTRGAVTESDDARSVLVPIRPRTSNSNLIRSLTIPILYQIGLMSRFVNAPLVMGHGDSDITSQTIGTIENEVYKAAMERGLTELTKKLQEMADAMPAEGSDFSGVIMLPTRHTANVKIANAAMLADNFRHRPFIVCCVQPACGLSRF